MTDKPNRILPNHKEFLNTVLPRAKGEHVLAVGLEHRQNSLFVFLKDHLAELSREHNVGTLGFEGEPSLNVFAWAYEEGKLPVSRDKVNNYLEIMYSCAIMPELSHTGKDQSAALTTAIDNGIDVVHFDARFSFEDMSKFKPRMTQLLGMVFSHYPDLLKEMRTNPEAYKQLGNVVQQVILPQQAVDISQLQSDAQQAFACMEVRELIRGWRRLG